MKIFLEEELMELQQMLSMKEERHEKRSVKRNSLKKSIMEAIQLLADFGISVSEDDFYGCESEIAIENRTKSLRGGGSYLWAGEKIKMNSIA